MDDSPSPYPFVFECAQCEDETLVVTKKKADLFARSHTPPDWSAEMVLAGMGWEFVPGGVICPKCDDE